ncbi:unnamed protein product [Ectocarpus sp. 8 AP-2014]
MKEVDEKIVFAKMDCTADGNKEFKEKMGIKGFPSFRMFEGTLESAKEHKPPRVMPQLMDYFKAIKDGVEPPPPPPAPKRPPAPPLVEPEDSEVTVLTKANFQEFVAGEFAVVEFYAPWCGHCKKLFPEYTKASKELKEVDPTIKLGKLDMDDPKTKAVGSKFGVKGFPTLKIFRNGKPEDYTGPRDAEGIVKFLTNLKKVCVYRRQQKTWMMMMMMMMMSLMMMTTTTMQRAWEARRRRPYLSRKSSKNKGDQIVLRMEEALFRNPSVVRLGVTTDCW